MLEAIAHSARPWMHPLLRKRRREKGPVVANFRIVLLEFGDDDVECFYSYLVLSARSTTLGIDGYVLTVVFA